MSKIIHLVDNIGRQIWYEYSTRTCIGRNSDELKKDGAGSIDIWD